MSAKKKKSWQEKLADSKGCPKVMAIEGHMRQSWGTGTFVVPAPMEVDGLMRRVRRGRLTTIDAIRKVLAQRHGATIACPITTGIFAWIAAHASAEATAAGAKSVTPYWRTLKSDGELNPKYPGGVAALKRHLRAEGHSFVQKGKRTLVKDFQQRLAVLEKSDPPS
jgi:hypothetical protein